MDARTIAEGREILGRMTAGTWFRVEPPWLPSNCPTYVIAGTPVGAVCTADWQTFDSRKPKIVAELGRILESVRADEREACAALAESEELRLAYGGRATAREIAAAIRRRGG